FLSLNGVAILYAQAGSLNFAQAGAALARNDPGGLFVPLVFLLVISGFIIKAAMFPFHLWLEDAHAVAPTPVCVLFSGVMVELGIYGVARVYWTVFASVPETHGPGLRAILLGFGTLGALLGATMCFLQRHLKRLLAYSTISHAG